MSRFLATSSAVLLLALSLPAQAGRSCDQQLPPSPKTLERGMSLAAQTAQALDASGAQVVLLARAGQDLSKYRLRYSHLGWAYKTPDGLWRVAHKLNDCGSANGYVYRQGLGEFFLDDLWRYEAVWQIPSPQIQQQLLTLLRDNARTTLLQHRPYSMVSYAWSQRYQQSNQWALETLAAAMEPARIRNRAQAQTWLREQGYQPTVLKIGPLTRLGGRITAANIAFDDHPTEERFADRIATVTVDSALAWLQRKHWAGAPQQLRLD